MTGPLAFLACCQSGERLAPGLKGFSNASACGQSPPIPCLAAIPRLVPYLLPSPTVSPGGAWLSPHGVFTGGRYETAEKPTHGPPPFVSVPGSAPSEDLGFHRGRVKCTRKDTGCSRSGSHQSCAERRAQASKSGFLGRPDRPLGSAAGGTERLCSAVSWPLQRPCTGRDRGLHRTGRAPWTPANPIPHPSAVRFRTPGIPRVWGAESPDLQFGAEIG